MQAAIGDIGAFSLVFYLIMNIVAACVREAHFKYSLITNEMKVRLSDHEKNETFDAPTGRQLVREEVATIL